MQVNLIPLQNPAITLHLSLTPI
ncbi:uncharacterized protein FFE2_16089 [Fusarium fujikuroi]|nr:uncharacterized protein FFE2_16089 [Fusarium fujikuroi]SCV61468.1 uncharacterized protein FFFS_16038 [Fusarium fujikuroi]